MALAAGSTNSRAKRWLPERFAQLADDLQSNLNVNVVLLGSKEDEEISRRVSDLSIRKPVDLTGKTDIVNAEFDDALEALHRGRTPIGLVTT